MNKYMQISIAFCFGIIMIGCASSSRQEINSGMISYLVKETDKQRGEHKELEEELEELQNKLDAICANNPDICKEPEVLQNWR